MRYNNSALQILRVRKEESEFYICSAENLLGKVEKKTLLLVVSLPRFTSKPPSKIVSMLSCTAVRLNCSAAGDPQPTISWRKQGGQLPVGRSQQINGALVITNLQKSDAGNYICTATSASVFTLEAVTALEINDKKGGILLWNFNCLRTNVVLVAGIAICVSFALITRTIAETSRGWKGPVFFLNSCAVPSHFILVNSFYFPVQEMRAAMENCYHKLSHMAEKNARLLSNGRKQTS